MRLFFTNSNSFKKTCAHSVPAFASGPNGFRNVRGSPDPMDVKGNSTTMEVTAMAGKTANISLEIDSGIKQRAMAALEARGMSLSGAIRRMVTLGILEHRIPFEHCVDSLPNVKSMSNLNGPY